MRESVSTTLEWCELFLFTSSVSSIAGFWKMSEIKKKKMFELSVELVNFRRKKSEIFSRNPNLVLFEAPTETWRTELVNAIFFTSLYYLLIAHSSSYTIHTHTKTKYDPIADDFRKCFRLRVCVCVCVCVCPSPCVWWCMYMYMYIRVSVVCCAQ